ncbi:hypothetical protein EV361DRAFT_104520 [Lentinula raphanica]|nr:hypothetical protein EV361DRAFT_104520 [Lentinula raphanica]
MKPTSPYSRISQCRKLEASRLKTPCPRESNLKGINHCPLYALLVPLDLMFIFICFRQAKFHSFGYFFHNCFCRLFNMIMICSHLLCENWTTAAISFLIQVRPIQSVCFSIKYKLLDPCLRHGSIYLDLQVSNHYIFAKDSMTQESSRVYS